MHRLNKAVFLTVLLQVPVTLGADLPGAVTCNQMGREIALRAAEELSVPLDAALRTELAAIAESTCVSYLPTAEDYAAADTAAAEDNTSATAATTVDENSGRQLFDLELIEPEDRVRRPGLKRR